jgi:hypothetical protein
MRAEITEPVLDGWMTRVTRIPADDDMGQMSLSDSKMKSWKCSHQKRKASKKLKMMSMPPNISEEQVVCMNVMSLDLTTSKTGPSHLPNCTGGIHNAKEMFNHSSDSATSITISLALHDQCIYSLETLLLNGHLNAKRHSTNSKHSLPMPLSFYPQLS